MSPWGYQGFGDLQESGSVLEWRIPYPLYGSFWELGLDENVNVSASILVAEDRCPVSLCLPLCKASSPPSHPMPVSGSGQFPGGTLIWKE